jgi:hypothetical protein
MGKEDFKVYHKMFPKYLKVDFNCPTMRAFRKTQVAVAEKYIE